MIDVQSLRTVFMGTPEFALPTLAGLLSVGVELCAVYTQPDRPSGRGKHLTAPPVKELAMRQGLSVMQPVKLREPAVVEELRRFAPDLIVVVAYGQILPKSILDLPHHGCINVHASLLPRYRGAAPVNQAIVDGEQVTGVTTMLMDEGLDTGHMLVRRATEIGFEETAGQLHDRLALLGREAMLETLKRLCQGTLRPEPQDDANSSYAPMMKKNQGRIDWRRDALSLHNLVRGLAPWPGAYTFWNGQLLKIAATLPEEDDGGPPGTVLSVGPDGVRIACGQGVLLVRELQLAGKKRLKAADFVRGTALQIGTRMEG